MADKALSKLGLRGFSGSQASVGAIALMAFLLAACLLPLIAAIGGPAQASPDPNFGYETKGEVTGILATNFIIGSEYSCPEVGTAISITAYLKQKSDLTPKIKFAIYKSSDKSLVAYTGEWTVTAGWDGEKTLNIVWGGALEVTDYYLVIWNDDDIYGYYTVAGLCAYDAETYGTWPDPWAQIDLGNQSYTIYCTYSTEAPPQEYERGVEQGFSVSATVEIEVERFAQEYERPIEQSFSLAESAPRGAEFGRVIEQGFSIGAAVGMVMVVCRLLSQAFGITGTIGVTSEWGKSLSQDFSLEGEVEAKAEYARSISQGFSLTGDVSANMGRWGAIDQAFSIDGVVSRELEAEGNVVQSFSLSAAVALAIEHERTLLQGFSLTGTAIIPHYGDIYVTSPWCDNRANPIDVVANPTFSAIYTVIDNNIPNPAQFIQVQIGTSLNDNDLWDNISAVTVENGQRSLDVSYGGTPLTLNSLYWWRCRLGDSNSNWTEWTSPQTFGYQEPPFDLVAAAMFIFPIVLMAIAFAFDNVVFASFAGIVFILSGLFFVDVIWLSVIFVGVGVYLLIAAFLSEED